MTFAIFHDFTCKIFFCLQNYYVIDCILWLFFFLELNGAASKTASQIPLHRAHSKSDKFRSIELLSGAQEAPPVPILEWTRNSPWSLFLFIFRHPG